MSSYCCNTGTFSGILPGMLWMEQMGYCSLEWNWPKEAMNRPIWASIVDGAKLF